MQKKPLIIFAISGVVLSAACMIKDYSTNRIITGYRLERNPFGSGQREETLDYEISDGVKGEITLQIPEETNTPRERKKLLKDALSQLDQQILGDNQSFSHVDRNLNLPDSLQDSPVSISWSSSRPDLIDFEGILSRDIPKNGTEVLLEAEVSLMEQSEIYQKNLKLFRPTPQTVREQLNYKIEDENSELEGKHFILPKSMDGNKITWKFKPSSTGVSLLILTFAIVLFLYLRPKKEQEQLIQTRNEQLMLDYPDIISKFLLLLSAGLSIRNCFERITMDYKKIEEEQYKKNHPVYEEIAFTYRQIKSGVSETTAYENLGKRCGCPAYKTFSTVLSQNARKGNKAIMDILEREAHNAFDQRKRNARITGEKAGTKLLVPMILMLGIVFLILMVPAYLSFTKI